MEEDLSLSALRFDIEDNDPPPPPRPAPPSHLPGGGRGRPLLPGSKDVVCMHYLVGMCALDKDCPFLHQYIQEKVPVCP